MTPTQPTAYLDTWTVVLLAVGLAVAGLCAVRGLQARPPDRLTTAATAVLQLVVTVVVASYLGRTLGGSSPVGPAWELWAYLVTVLMLPPAAWLWARSEPTRWSTLVLAMAAFVTAVMGARAAQIWYGVGLG